MLITDECLHPVLDTCKEHYLFSAFSSLVVKHWTCCTGLGFYSQLKVSNIYPKDQKRKKNWYCHVEVLSRTFSPPHTHTNLPHMVKNRVNIWNVSITKLLITACTSLIHFLLLTFSLLIKNSISSSLSTHTDSSFHLSSDSPYPYTGSSILRELHTNSNWQVRSVPSCPILIYVFSSLYL